MMAASEDTPVRVAILAICTAIAVAPSAPRAAPAYRYTLTDLGQLRGDTIIYPTGINSAGEVVGVSYGPHHPESRVFLWREGAIAEPEGMDPVLSSPWPQINDFGQVVATSNFGGLVWTPKASLSFTSGGAIALLTATPVGLNNGGSIVGYEYDAKKVRHPLRWNPGKPNGLLEPAEDLTSVLGDAAPSRINDSGQILAATAHSIYELGTTLLYTPGFPVTTLTAPGDSSSYVTDPWALNNRGQVLVVYHGVDSATNMTPFLWTPSEANGTSGAFTELAHDFHSAAFALNSRGEAVGRDIKNRVGLSATYWPDAKTEVMLDDVVPTTGGLHLDYAQSINDAGQIVAQGNSFRREPRAYLLTPVQLPAKLAWFSVTSPGGLPSHEVSMRGGQQLRLNLMLTGPAPAGGAAVRLTSSGNLITGASWISVAPGQTNPKLPAHLTSVRVRRPTPVILTASYGGVSKSVSITLLP